MSFNEPPRAGLPDDVIQRDFEGVFADSEDPIPELRRHLEEWRNEDVLWWTLRSEQDLEQLNRPISDSRDEWADAIHGLDRLIVEGLSVSNLRQF
ncbi:MAG: hypothetical protein MI724_06115 [Spirochaetales bacterium]|nr:hypothetical protein [Spirochaetales bacterium]